MAINPYDKWPKLDIKPLDFGQLMQAQQYINQAETAKLDRDLKAYEDLSKLKTTHIQQIPGSVDEARQKAIEEEQAKKLDEYTELYSKGKMGYRDLMLGMIDIKNKIANPVSLIGNENYKSWEKTQGIINEMKAKGQGYSPALHANFLDASNFDSAAGHRWTKSPEAYQSAAIAETFYNNLTPFEDPFTGAQTLTPEMIMEHTKNNLGLIMNEPFTQQQIDIARSRGDQRSAQEIATEIWYNKGLEYQQQKYPTPTAGTSGGGGGGKGDTKITTPSTPTPYDFPLFNLEPTYGSSEDYVEQRQGIKEEIKNLSSALADVSQMPDAETRKQAIMEAFRDPKVEYIKLADGHVYNKEDVSAGTYKGKIMDAVYEDQVGNKLTYLQDQDAALTSDNEQILKNMFEKEYGAGSYNSLRNQILDSEGNYISSEVTEQVKIEASNEANKVYRKALERGDPNASKIFEDAYNKYIETHDPKLAKFNKLYDEYYNKFYNPDVSIKPSGYLFSADDEIKEQLPQIVNTFNTYDAQGNKINPNDAKQMADGKMNIVGWAVLPDKGVVIQAENVNAKKGTRSEPFFIDITGSYENEFYRSRGLAGENAEVIRQQVERHFSSPIAEQAGEIFVDGKKYTITTKNGEKYIGYTDDVSNKYVQKKVGAVDSQLLAKQLEILSGTQKVYNLDRITMGLLGAEGGQNIRNLAGVSSAQGYFQIIPSKHENTLIELGFNPRTPGFSLLKLSFADQAKIARRIIEKNEAIADKLYGQFGNMPGSPLSSLEDFSWAAYYLGTGGLEKWLRTYNTLGLEEANKTIPNYPTGNVGLDKYISAAKKKADKFSEEQKQKYSR